MTTFIITAEKWVKGHAKAIAGVVAPVVVLVAAHFGFHVDVNVAGVVITGVLSGLAVYQVPNTPPAGQ